VTTARLPAWPRPVAGGRRSSVATVFVVVAASLVTASAAVGGNGNLIIVLAPFALAAGVWGVCVTPIRHTLFSMVFLCLALDATGEGPWDSPLARFGALLGLNLNKSIPLSLLTFPGFALILGFLLVIHIHRRLSGSMIDGISRPNTPKPFLAALGASLVAVSVLVANGVRHGGDIQMAKSQVQFFVLLLLMSYLSAASLRGTRDYRILAKGIVAAACIKAAYALYVVQRFRQSYELANGELAFATSHGDSLLFAFAIVITVAQFGEQPSWRHGRWCVLALPLLIAGTAANNRRLAWVEIVAGLLVFVLISRRTRLKRFFVHAMLLALPVFATYVAVGWNSTAKVFAPIHIFRSVSDSEIDPSTLYRETENYNLLATLRLSPLIGTGFGRPFVETVKMGDISFFKEYRYLPHNSILGLWAFTGAFGFTILSSPIVVGVYFAGRSYYAAQSAGQRVAAIMAIATVAIYLVHCWGDIGFSERRSIFLVRGLDPREKCSCAR